jgi:hypothetical protein
VWNSALFSYVNNGLRVQYNGFATLGAQTPVFSIESGQEYVVSFDAASYYNTSSLNYNFVTVSGTGVQTLPSVTVVNTDTNWRRYELKFTSSVTNASARILLGRSGGSSSSDGFLIRRVKVEKGNKATDWDLAKNELRTSKFILDQDGAKFYGDGFKLYNNTPDLKVFFDLVKDALNLGINVNMPIYEPTNITELVEILVAGLKGLQFGEPDIDGFYKAFITAVNTKTVSGLSDDYIQLRMRSQKVDIIGDDAVTIQSTDGPITLDGEIVNIGDVVHMTFGGTKYLITRDSNGFLKATTTV